MVALAVVYDTVQIRRFASVGIVWPTGDNVFNQGVFLHKRYTVSKRCSISLLLGDFERSGHNVAISQGGILGEH